MTTRRRLLELLTAGGTLAGLRLPAQARIALAAAGAPPGKVLVPVIHPSFDLHEISLDTLRAIFMGQSVPTPAGERFIPINDVPNGPARLLFDRLVLRMDGDQSGQYWLERKIRGQGNPPRSWPQGSLRMRLVAHLPQAITYVWSEELDATVRPLRVNGKSASDRGYPLLG